MNLKARFKSLAAYRGAGGSAGEAPAAPEAVSLPWAGALMANKAMAAPMPSVAAQARSEGALE